MLDFLMCMMMTINTISLFISQLAEKELQKINAFKAPQEKLSTIMNCCRVINNLLLNAAMSEHVPAGADDFIPVLIYVTIKARQALLGNNTFC